MENDRCPFACFQATDIKCKNFKLFGPCEKLCMKKILNKLIYIFKTEDKFAGEKFLESKRERLLITFQVFNKTKSRE